MSDQTADPQDAQRIREHLETVRAEVRRASTAAHGDPEAVRILLATKTQPAARIRAAIEAGAGLIGENRVQELQEKAPELADLPHEAHLIGPLQRNKVNHTLRAGAVCVQSIDTLAVAQKLSDRIATLTAEGPQAPAAEAPVSPVLDVLIQVNTSREDTKSGVAPADAEELVTAVRALPHLRIRGLMTIGLPGETDDVIRPSYAELRELSQTLRDAGVPPADATELSMGMSADY